MEFVKMHGIGNDYVFVDCFRQKPPADPARAAIAVSRPHVGVGADGLILMLPDEECDARMRIFNADGSEGEMCGNGIRCMGKYLYDSGLVRRERMTIRTGGGVRALEIIEEGGTAAGARVDMGEPELVPAKIPVSAPENRIVLLFPDGRTARFTCVGMGNPHAVTLDRFPDGDAFRADGAFVETHPMFPNRVNASFVRVDDATHLTARIWERGSGATMACGSGACAALVAASLNGACADRAHVRLPGGQLFIEYDRAHRRVFMTGPAKTAFTGTMDLENIEQ